MRSIFNLTIALTLFSCGKISDKNFKLFGHAGMGLDMTNSIYHDNTKEAIELCLSIPGSNGVEVDVQMDSQGSLWLYHDELLNNNTTLNGCINEKTTIELQDANYKTLKEEKLVELSQIISILGKDQTLFLDLKIRNSCSDDQVNFDLFLTSLIQTLGSDANNIMIIASDSIWLKELASYFPVLYSSDNFEEAYDLLGANNLFRGLVIRNKAINKSQITSLRKINKEVYLFDIRSPKGNRNAMLKNPTGIITDDIRAALIERSK